MKLVLVALLLALPSAGATGPTCPTHLVIDSRGVGQVEGSTNQASVGFCQQIHGGPAPLSQEKRVLTPESDHVSVRFLDDWGVATLPATLDGMGYANAPLTLTRATYPLNGTHFYELGAWLVIPPDASGALTATVALPDGTTESVTYEIVI